MKTTTIVIIIAGILLVVGLVVFLNHQNNQAKEALANSIANGQANQAPATKAGLFDFVASIVPVLVKTYNDVKPDKKQETPIVDNTNPATFTGPYAPGYTVPAPMVLVKP